MAEAPQRPYRHRTIDGFDRSRVRREVLATKGRKFLKLRKRYATLVLGASLAVGGIGIPLKASRMLDVVDGDQTARGAAAGEANTPPSGFGAPVESSEEAPIPPVASAIGNAVDEVIAPARAPAQNLHFVTEKAREEFFRAEVPFGSIIYKEAKKNDISPELLAAVVKTESQFRPTARSQRGAQGLMQLVPKTGRWMGATNLMNPNENVKAGAKYLKYLSERFDGDQQKIIAAYNAGEGNVRRFGGIPPFRETQKYVRKVLTHQNDFRNQVSGKAAESLDNTSVDEVADLSPVR